MLDFTTLPFLAFIAVVAVLYRLAPPRIRPGLLLVSSSVFYALWSGWMTLLLLTATAVTFLAARALEVARFKDAKRVIMLSVVVALVGLVALFKSAPYTRDLFRKNLSWDILMPLGLSYFTFKLIGYVVDVYWGKIAAERNFVSFAAYVTFFPQIVAGPIQRSETLLPQIQQATPVWWSMVLLGMQRILLGYFKKFVVADHLALLVNFVYGHIHESGTPLILGYYAYPLQMYADFSGLTDIAIGSALLLGIVSPENFNAPFSAVSPSEYWRRWHITLTLWLTDYVFTPLRMSMRLLGNTGLVISLLVNMVLIGIWHGFRWSFALFGVVHAIYLSIDALTSRFRKRYYKLHPEANRITNWVGPVVTFHLVAIAFVFFRGESVDDILYILAHLGQGISQTSSAFQDLIEASGRAILVGFAGYFLMEIADWLRRHYTNDAPLPRWRRWSLTSCTAAALVFVILLMLASRGTRNPFLYAIF